ncbi:YdbH domain-containing protein [Shewanella gelidimarina]|uniref:YdbH domain-containing protein n=1 Tax=Shewanella gelidimarina TaxID=56813 RepID=UPI00200F0B98|nr:YdbH domain-containing protein [Shewanella gelidimarina]
MQQWVPKTFSQTARRLLLISFGIILSATLMTALYVGWNYQRLTIKLANHFLQPYQMQIEQLSVKPLTFTHWQVPFVSLTVNNSNVEITELDIVLGQDAAFWALSVADLRSLSAKSLKVQLDPSVLRHSTTPNNDPGPTMALDFTALPEIQIGQTQFTVKGVTAAKLNMTLEHLTLDQNGHFSSEISHNQHSVFALKAQLSSSEWRATTRLDLTQLQVFSADIHAAETTLFPSFSDADADANTDTQQDRSLFAPLYALQTAIQAQRIELNATLDSSITLAIKSGQLQSEHRLSQLQIRLNALAGLQLTPTLMVNDSNDALTDKKITPPTPLKQQGQLAFNIDGHIADLKLTLQPFELPIALKKPLLVISHKSAVPHQLVSLLNHLDDAPLEAALAHLYQVLSSNSSTSPSKMGPVLRIKVVSPLVYQLNDKALSLPTLSVAIENTKLAAVVRFQDIDYNSQSASANTSTAQQGDYQLAFGWQLQASHQQNITINTLWPTLAKLPYKVAIDNASLALRGQFSALKKQGKSAYKVSVLPQASQLTQGITLTPNKADLDNQHDPLLTANIAETQLVWDSAAEYRFANGQTHISIPALHYHVNNAELSQQNNDEQQTHYQLFIDAMDIALNAPISLSLDSNNSQPFISQLMRQKQVNRLHLSLENLVLDKSALALKSKKSAKIKKAPLLTKQTLLHLYQVELSQQIDLDSGQLSTGETWLINGLDLSSQHHYLPLKSTPSQFQLEGDWQFSSDFEPILAFFSQSNSLPESIDLNGNAALNMHYQLNRDKYTRFALALEPTVTDIQGSFADLPFEGGNMKTQCQYDWQQAQNSTSSFHCDDITLSLLAFNPGVLMTDIEAKAAVSFSTDSNQSTAESSSSSQHKLALPAELLGIKQASISLTAKGDLLNGQLLIPQFQLNLKQPSSAYFVLQHIDLEELLTVQPQVGVYADGIFDAVLPVTLENGHAAIAGGQIAARAPGGLIAVSGNPAVDQMRLSQPYLEFAFSALEHLAYSELSSSFDMDSLGNAILKVNVEGQSRGIERPIHLNYSQEENMLQLLRSLQIGNNLQNQIENSIQQ